MYSVLCVDIEKPFITLSHNVNTVFFLASGFISLAVTGGSRFNMMMSAHGLLHVTVG